MIRPRLSQTTEAVAAHYDELDQFYREIWGEHVHHGYWRTGRETSSEATDALVDLLADRLGLTAGQAVCDIGCGYGAAAQRLAERHDLQVTGVTVSAAQARRGAARAPIRGRMEILLQDWLSNGFGDAVFDQGYAIESSEHMPDMDRCFDEAYRTIRRGGGFAVLAWLASDTPRGWQIRHLLEPICREGRLPGLATVAEYRDFGARAGFDWVGFEDLSVRVRRTWVICVARAIGRLATDARYRRFVTDATATNRVFALTLIRILAAYYTGSMRYGLLLYRKPAEATSESTDLAPTLTPDALQRVAERRA